MLLFVLRSVAVCPYWGGEERPTEHQHRSHRAQHTPVATSFAQRRHTGREATGVARKKVPVSPRRATFVVGRIGLAPLTRLCDRVAMASRLSSCVLARWRSSAR